MPKNSAKSKAAEPKSDLVQEVQDIVARELEAELEASNAALQKIREEARQEIAAGKEKLRQEFERLTPTEQALKVQRMLQVLREDREAFARERADFKTEYDEEKAARLAKASLSNILQFYKRDNNEDPVNRLRPDNEMLWPWRELDKRRQPRPSLWIPRWRCHRQRPHGAAADPVSSLWFRRRREEYS
jgi:hypothetical protein